MTSLAFHRPFFDGSAESEPVHILANGAPTDESAWKNRIRGRVSWLLAWLLTILLKSVAIAQPVGDLPSARYFASRELYRMGNVFDAAAGFQEILTRAQRTANDGWIDSVPTMVMLAECHYQRGELAKSLELYDAALMIVLKFPGWLDQFNLGDNALAVSEASIKGVNWFKPSQTSTSLSLPSSVQMRPDLTQARADAQGNVIAPLNVTARLDSTEVLRTISVALMRRWQLLGPLAQHSPLTAPVAKYFSGNVNQQQLWAQASWLVLRGLSTLPNDETQAAQQLQAAAYLNNRQFDYFLTPIALQVLGEIAAKKGQYQAAIVHFQDSSLLSAQYLQYDQLSETLLWIGDCGCANDRIDLLESVLAAATWCSKRSAFGQAAGLCASAELAVRSNKLAQARKLNSQSAALLKPNKGALPRFQARLAYNEAILAFTENQPTVGWSRANDAVSQMRGNAASGAIPAIVFQQQLTLDLIARGNITLADGDKLLEQLLAEPNKIDWELRPLETLAALTTAAVPAYQRWLKLSDPADKEMVLTRLNLVQQRQVNEALPLGGRLFSWKQAVLTPLGELPPDVRPIVQTAAQQHPLLEQLPVQLIAATEAVRKLPFELDERQIKSDQKQAYTFMEEVAERLESQLMNQSLSRKPLRRFSPGEWNTELTQQRLADGDLLLGFVEAGEELFGVAVTNDSTHSWRISDSAAIATKMSLLYKQLSLVRSGNLKLAAKVTDSGAEWRITASELFKDLFGGDPAVAAIAQSSRRWIVAPHGPLWYMPFELLISDKQGARGLPIIASTAVAYVPTLASSYLAYAPSQPEENSLVLLSNFFAADKSQNQKEAQLVSDIVDNTSIVSLEQKQSLPSTQWLRCRIDHLISLVLQDATADNGNLRVMPIENSSKSRIGDWIGSTLKTPDLVFLPGVETSIRSGKMGNGNEIFMPVCAILYSGSRGMISRWSVGGESSSRYLQRMRLELKASSSISSAMRRAAISLWAEQFATASEPILLPAGNDTDILTSGEHPLLWGSYMAIGDRVSK